MSLSIQDNIVRSVCDHIHCLKQESSEFCELYDHISKGPQLVLFGGAIRDIIEGVPPRDYDFVVDMPSASLKECLGNFKYRQNSFGGFKVELSKLELDVWSLQDTWAFRNKYLLASVDNLQDTVFFNIDSILMELNSRAVFANGFIEAMTTNRLDIVLERNPMPALSVLRAFVFERRKKMTFSTKLQQYISSWASSQSNPVNELMQVQLKHYKHEIFDEDSIRHNLSCCC